MSDGMIVFDRLSLIGGIAGGRMCWTSVFAVTQDVNRQKLQWVRITFSSYTASKVVRRLGKCNNDLFTLPYYECFHA